LRPNHFRGKDRDSFVRDFLVPFFRNFSTAIRQEIPDAIMFCEPVVNFEDLHGDPPPKWLTDKDVGPGYVCRFFETTKYIHSLTHSLAHTYPSYTGAKHYYDGMTLITKQFRNWIGLDQIKERPVFLHSNVVNAHAKTLRHYANEARVIGSKGCPTLIGETGIPFDLGRGPGRNENRACAAMNTTMSALERNMLNFTLWTYVVDNSFESGDQWCGEDLSIWSRDQKKLTKERNCYAGGRALRAVIRPYAHLVAGTPLKMSYDPYNKKRIFEFFYECDDTSNGSSSSSEMRLDDPMTSVFYVPQYVYRSKNQTTVIVSIGCDYVLDWDAQTLLVKRPRVFTRTVFCVRIYFE